MSPRDASIDPLDPVFISYRQSDGSKTALRLAQLLRAAGIPVWLDRDDLPPGDTDTRLEQAISDGISGGILVVTDDIAFSRVVKQIEAPKLIELHNKDRIFALGIVNSVTTDDGRIDYAAPDNLLDRRSGTLSGVEQRGASHKDLLALVGGMARHRIAHLRKRIEADNHTFSFSVQTRNTAQVYDRSGDELDIRLRPSNHERLPSARGLRDLRDTIGMLPDIVTRSGARRVRIQGGAHLSVAFALGAALPSTRIGQMEVIDKNGESWLGDGEPHVLEPPTILTRNHGKSAYCPSKSRPAAAVYVDISEFSSDAAFTQFLEDNAPTLSAWEHLTYKGSKLVDPSEGGRIAAEVAARIRAISYENINAEVHLLLHCPFPLALLIGRLTNTLRFVVYEWNDTEALSNEYFQVRYTPTIKVRTGANNGVIEKVLLPERHK